MENRDWVIEITIAFNSARILCYLEKISDSYVESE